jgi:hypothetical protein
MRKNDLATNFVLENTSADLVLDYVTEKEWNEDADLVQRVTSGILTDEDKSYLEDQVGDLSHKRDDRTTEEYVSELFRSWLIEDVLVDLINDCPQPITAEHAGKDAQRKLLSNTSTKSDFKVKYNETARSVEQTSDYTNYWGSVGEMDLRGKKIQTLKQQNGLILGFNVQDQEVILVDPAKKSASKTDNHTGFGGKDANMIDVSEANSVALEDIGELLLEAF